MSKWIRKGDRVLVVAGNDRGKFGEVLSRGAERVIVQGINVRKKHMKRTQESQGGRIVEMEVPIHVSNVCLCDKDGKKLKVQLKHEKSGQKDLVHKKGAKGTVHRAVKKVKHV
ncbi:MAG: 50S ribosomal protein L24 [Chlamydiae bacterium CG10_big_fil_rev_8_21_14_0_10_42_34]|nr:MAG: 50S ribosomal protein L24 [Chlamydiae bacterium CG10_big_fil_rev_8_21_14_0_10_42_34]